MSRMTTPGKFRRDREGNHARHTRRPRWFRRFLIGFLLVGGGAAALAGVLVAQALQVRDDLLAVEAQLGALTDAYNRSDLEGMHVIAQESLRHTEAAATTVRGPLWSSAAHLPIVGANVSAVRKATEATDMIVRDALPQGIELLGALSPDALKVTGGGLNLQPLLRAQQVLPEIQAVLTHAKETTDGVESDALLPVVRDAVGQLTTTLDRAGPALEFAARFLPVTTRIAGSEGPRDYLVIFQNNAEIRATGGNAATSTVIHVENGSVSRMEGPKVDNFLRAGVEGWLEPGISSETLALYERDFAQFSQNFSRTPDFPVTAQLFSQLWMQTNGEALDGVISVDPVSLSYMLAATGPLALADGTIIDSSNAVKRLLSESYEQFGMDGDAADLYFADIASRVFDMVAQGSWSPRDMLTAVSRSIDEHRIYAWFSREDENSLGSQIGVSGALTADNSAQTQVGIFLNDAAYSKLEYYLSTSMTVRCDAEARTLTTSLTMTSSVPGSWLSGYTLGWRNSSLSIPNTTMILDTLYVAPPDTTIVTIDPREGDIEAWSRNGMQKGHESASRTMLLAAGETRTVSFMVQLPAERLAPLDIRFSPTVAATPISIDGSCSSLFAASK